MEEVKSQFGLLVFRRDGYHICIAHGKVESLMYDGPGGWKFTCDNIQVPPNPTREQLRKALRQSLTQYQAFMAPLKSLMT